MVQVFIIFLIIILVLAAGLGAAVAFRSKEYSTNQDELDRQYIDKDGNHIYYDRSRIAKEDFIRNNPNENPRTFSRLFKRK